MIFCNGVPKTGTHLLLSYAMQLGCQLYPRTVKGYGPTLKGLPDPMPADNWCCHAHVPAKHDLPGQVLTIFRHPRDTLISFCRYTGTDFEVALRRYYGGRPFVNLYWEFLPWRQRGRVFYFEEMTKTCDSRTFSGRNSDWREHWTGRKDFLWMQAGGYKLEQALGYTA